MNTARFEPPGLQKAFFLEDLNGFGFQVAGLKGKDTIAFARLPDDAPSDLQQKLRKSTGSTTVEHRDFIGHEYLTIDYREWNLIPRLFVAAIKAGCSAIYPNINNLQPRARFAGHEFSFEEAELLSIAEFRQFAQSFGNQQNPMRNAFELLGSPKAMRRLYNYRTNSGKLFCIELCAALGKPIADTSEKALTAMPWWFELPEVDEACRNKEVLHYANWSRREMHYTANKPEVEQRHVDPDNEPVKCVVCMERIANTIALPCEHVVVCHLCSVKLAQTHFAHQCVYCRQQIEEVLSDEQVQPPAVVKVEAAPAPAPTPSWDIGCDGYCGMGCLQPQSSCKCGPARNPTPVIQPGYTQRSSDCDGYCGMGCLAPSSCKCNSGNW